MLESGPIRGQKVLIARAAGGGQDPVTDQGSAMSWLAARLKSLDINNVHLTIYSEMRHETLNEIGRWLGIGMADLAAALAELAGYTHGR